LWPGFGITYFIPGRDTASRKPVFDADFLSAGFYTFGFSVSREEYAQDCPVYQPVHTCKVFSCNIKGYLFKREWMGNIMEGNSDIISFWRSIDRRSVIKV